MTIVKKFIGDRAFYKTVLMLVIPIVVQQGVSSFVNLLDNIMVGSLGTEVISGVAIVNQLIFVYNLAIFGGLSGISIFGAQFFGKGDHEGLRNTFRFKLLFGTTTLILALFVLYSFGDRLIMLFLENEANRELDLSITLNFAKEYMNITLLGLIPFTIIQIYSNTLRETGNTLTPMTASLIAIFLNLILNWLLIFGNLGFPKMGVAGAALATVLARIVEVSFLVIHTHKNKKKHLFLIGAYKSFVIPWSLVKRIIITGSPLLMNEVLWSLGMTLINQSYSTRGITVVAANNISSTVWYIFCIIMYAIGGAVGIIVGQKLGSGDIEGAKDTDLKLIFLTIVANTVVGLLLIFFAPLIPMFYNTEDEVRKIATSFLMIAGASLPIHAFIHTVYATIRSGGKTFITFLFDCVYIWCVPVVLSFTLCRFTSLSIVLIYFIVQFSIIIKIGIGVALLRSGIWAKNIVSSKNN